MEGVSRNLINERREQDKLKNNVIVLKFDGYRRHFTKGLLKIKLLDK